MEPTRSMVATRSIEKPAEIHETRTIFDWILKETTCFIEETHENEHGSYLKII
jgi:hypothetical protein